MNANCFGVKVSVGYGVTIYVADYGPGFTRFCLPNPIGWIPWADYESDTDILRRSPFGLKESVERLRKVAKKFKKLGCTNPRCRRRRIRIHGQEFYYTAFLRSKRPRHIELVVQKDGGRTRNVCLNVMSVGDLYAYAYNNRYGRRES